MPGQALYLKYRPRDFDEIQGQEHVTRTLKNAIAQARIAHAYLFTGPRGTGKTSTARILAKAVNCLAPTGDRPCNQCAICRAINEGRMLDLIEIDAASNTGVDDIRSLREKVDFRPGEAQFKVYIIDEVHMLSTAAFNALLKTLEEPPPHVIFVLATTDPQKIPATVLSRVQRFDFRRLTMPEITSRLKSLAEREQVRIESAAVDLIARHATGALRDAESVLDQLISYCGNDITVAQAQGLLGAGSHDAVSRLVNCVVGNDISGGLEAIAQAIDSGADSRQFAREVVEYLRGLLLVQNGNSSALSLTADTIAEMSRLASQLSPDRLLRAVRLFNQAAFELRVSANPILPIELALVESILEKQRAPISVNSAKVENTTKPVSKTAGSSRREPGKASLERKIAEPRESIAPSGALGVEALRTNWDRVLVRVRVQNKVAEALLRGAEPIRVEQDLVVLGFFYQGHAERFEKEANGKMLIEKALSEVFDQKCRVKCILSPRRAKLKAVEEDPLIRAAVNQMGAEITEIHEQE